MEGMEMTTHEAKQLFDYNAWANARMFSAAEALTAEQLEAPLVSSFPSLKATLSHIVVTEWVWLRRWRGESPTAAPAWAEEPSLRELKSQLADIEAERASFLAGRTDADLEDVISYRGGDGQAFAHPLPDLIRHVVNHSTYHRGQLVTLLRQLGHTPPSTDFTRYLREGATHDAKLS
jgi:uncharacterized damage-inducible protein DinB